MAGPARVPLVAGARLPLAFIGTGLLALLAAAVWLVREPQLMLTAHLAPRVVAFVHLWLPGFLLSLCIGAIYQLMPVVLGTPLRLPLGAAWSHLGLHVLALPLLVGGFVTARFGWVALGGVLLLAGLVVLAVGLLRTYRASDRRDAVAASFPLAAGWLLLTVAVGVVIALNRRMPFLPGSILDLLRAHAHLGLVGFFLTLLQGVTFQLVPMFTMGVAARPRWIASGLEASQLALLLLAPGLAWQQPVLVLAGTVILLIALACSGFALRATLASRRRRRLEPGLRAFVIGAGLLAGAAAVGLTLVVMPAGSAPFMPLVSVYGVFGVLGGLSLMVLGVLCKILPFLVWMRVYGPRVGRQPVPLATSLAARPLEQAWLALHLTALVLLAAALASGQPALAVAGSVSLAAAIGLFLLNACRVLAHLIRPAQGAPAATPSPHAHLTSSFPPADGRRPAGRLPERV